MLRFIIITLILMTSVSEAHSDNLRVLKALPFELSIVSVDGTSGGNGTRITAQIKNGPNDLASVKVHCEAKSAASETWDLNGKAFNIAASEVRNFTILSDSKDDVAAKTITCSVSGFDIPIVIDP